MNHYRVPNLYFVGQHIARTIIEGCTTECGVPLVKGTNWSRHPPQYVCVKCHDLIERVPTYRG